MRALLLPTLFFFIISFPVQIEEKGESYRGLASAWTIIPSRSLAGLHYIFKDYKINDERDMVQVSGPVIEITNGETLAAKVIRGGFSTEIDLEDFEEEQSLGQSVFEARTGSGTNVGTAFLVGQDVVLTNRHVMAIKQGATTWPCGKFSIKLNHREESVACKKVLYCSTDFDYCVVQMENMSDGKFLSDEVKPLRLTRKIKTDKDTNLLHIGNAAGFGLQASRGRGITIQKGEFFHYTPTLGGSSGAPIFNEKGSVIGINWGHTGGNYIDDTAFNRGVLTKTIFDELKNHSRSTLMKIKSFRPWYYRIFSHRNVKIEEPKESASTAEVSQESR